MKNNTFDYIIVGAGPAGMFASLEIIKKQKKSNIALFELGPRIEKRKSSDVMSGVGGAGTYSDGKMHFSPTLSHEKILHLIDVNDYQNILDEVDKIYTDYGVDGEYFPQKSDEIKRFIEEAQRININLIPRRIRHTGTDKLKGVMQKFQDDLIKKGVNIIEDTEIVDIIIEKGVCKGVIDKAGNKYFAKKILLSPGRIKAGWLQTIAKKHDIKYMYDIVEVGVRIEFPSFVMSRFSDIMYEATFKVRTKTYDDIIRTFCPCPNGTVSVEKYEDFVCVNGQSNSDHNSENSNFAFVCEVKLTEPVENTIAYAKAIAQLATTIGGGKPIVQRLHDLIRGQRSTQERIRKSLVKPSLKDATPGDIAMALPYRIVRNILDGLEQLNRIMPGINSDSTLLYAPEVKFRTTKFATNSALETDSIKNLFVAGDASGLSGSITGAAASGIMAARGMVRK